MKGRLVSVATLVVVSGALTALVNCGGGERPLVSDDLAPDAGGGPTGDGSPAVTITGFDPAKGIVFGDDGFVNCGAQAPDKVVTLKNTSGEVVNYKAKMTSGAALYKLSPEEGGVPARGEVGIQIVPTPIPQASDVTPDLYAGTLEIQLSNGTPPTVIRLHQTARGAIVTTTLPSTAGFDFGAVKIATTATHQFSLTNAGNVEVTASLGLGTQQFRLNGADAATVSLKPGQTASQALTFSPALTDENYNDTLALSFNSAAVHCKPPPASTNVKGKGTTSVGVTPGTLNFGQVDCGSKVGFQTVTITSTAAMTFTPVLGKQANSPFTLAKDPEGTAVPSDQPISMGANATYVLRVVPKAIPSTASVAANAYGDKLTITSSVPGDTPHVVDLQQTASGAIFTLTGSAADMNLTVTKNDTGVSFTKPFTIKNEGNKAAPYAVTVTSQSAPGGTFVLNVGAGDVGAGATVPGSTVTMRAPDVLNVQYNGAISLGAPGAVLCADLPPNLAVSIRTPAQ